MHQVAAIVNKASNLKRLIVKNVKRLIMSFNLEKNNLKGFKTSGNIKGAVPVCIALVFARRRKAKVAIVAKGKNFFHLFQHGRVVAFASGYANALDKASRLERGVFHEV